MKIAIPLESKSLDTPICQSFGRTPFYLIYSTENDLQEYLDNSAAVSEGGAGIKAAQMLVDNGIDAVIAFRLGENAYRVLQPANINIYKAQQGTAIENIQSLKAGKLNKLNNIHPGFHNHGGAGS